MLKTLGGDVDGFQPRLAVFPGGTPLATNARVSVKVGIFEKVGARKETRTHVVSVKNVKFIGASSFLLSSWLLKRNRLANLYFTI